MCDLKFLSLFRAFSFFVIFALPLSSCQKDAQKEASQVEAQSSQHKFLDIKEVVSDGGIHAWLVEDHSLPIISMDYAFKGRGTKNDPLDKQGIVRLVSNTMDEGAGDLDAQAFQKMLQDHSISLSFGADRDHFTGSLKTLSKNADKAFELLQWAVNDPRFDEEPLARMRTANQSRIRSSLSNPRWLAARLQNDVLFEGKAYAKNSGGTLSSLEKITADDLRAFHQTLGKNQLVVAVTGDIAPSALKKRLDQVFGALPDLGYETPKKHGLENAGEIFLYKQNIPQTVIEIAQPGISRQDKDFYSAYLMNFILGGSGFGSHLMEEIREKRGLTYGVYSYFHQYDETDTLNVTTSTENKNVPEMLSLIKKEWEKMRNTPVSEEELDQAKAYIIGSLPLSLTSMGAISGMLLSLQLDDLPIDYLDRRADMINAVRLSDVEDISKNLLDTDQMTIIMVGNPPDDFTDKIEIVTELPNVK